MFEAKLTDICNKIIQTAREVEVMGGSEEDLKIRVEGILREIWDKLGVPEPRYEYPVRGNVTAKHWKRVDALYGLTIFEYKRPNELSRVRTVEEAVRKMKEEYIPALLNDPGVYKHVKAIEGKDFVPVIAGIILDGYKVIFCEYNCKTKEFKRSDIYDLNPEVLRRIVRIVVSTYKKKIDARVLASDFGYKSEIVRTHGAIRKLYEKLENPGEKTDKLFKEWKKLTSHALYLSGEELKKIAEDYGLKGEVDGLKLFFAIQTYYALIIKLLAVEVCARFYDSTIGTFFRDVEEAIAKGELKEVLERLENGWYYTYFGIKNFLEGEFFSWYIDEWDNEIEGVIRKIIEKLLEYDIESIVIDPGSARDVFKLLYEELVPRKEIRQKLGIYTTPDWLAELIIDEVSKGKDIIDAKWLDPGCGTGTFLSLIIKKIAEAGRNIPKHELLRKICSNVIGFDIDSLAVLTSRANYLIALASTGLLEHKGDEKVEIPVYLANSIVTVRELEEEVIVDNKTVKVVQIKAGDEIFQIPSRIVDKAVDLLNDFKDYIEAESPFGAVKEIEKYNLTKEELKLVQDVYEKLLSFKKRGIDSVWIPILKSYLVSTYYKDFDFIVGNPPWIVYRYLPEDYQEEVKLLTKDVYGLVTDEHLITHMEMATLFLIRCLDVYLKEDGIIGFVMPKSIMYADQHHNFRTQNVAIGYKIEKIIDCKVQPLFYVPACAIIVRKKLEKSEEIPALFLEGRLPEDKHKIMPLNLAISSLRRKEGKLYLNFIGSRSFLDEKKIEIVRKKSYYYGNFYQGATIVPQPCWFVDIVDERVPLIKTSERAKVRGKVEYEIGPLPIEREFLYYVLTSAEVLLFCHLEPNIAVLPIIPHGDKYFLVKREMAIDSGKIHLAKWLEKVEEIWEKVGGGKAKKISVYDWLDYQHKLTNQNPNAKYIVVYLRSATHLASCVIDNEHWREKGLLKKPVIVGHTLYRFFTNSEEEAYYLTAILNSSVLDELIKPMQSKGFTGAERDISKKPLEFPIPSYNEDNEIHSQLSGLGKKATEKAYKVLPRIMREREYDIRLKERGTLIPTEVAVLRTDIRNELQDELAEINRLVVDLLGARSHNPHATLDKFGIV